MYDYSEYADVKTEKLKLDELQTAIESQSASIEAKIDEQKAELKESEAQMRVLSTKTIPGSDGYLRNFQIHHNGRA